MLDSLFDHAVHRPQTIAFVDDDSDLDYRTLALRVAGFADELRTTGPTVGILAPNGVDWVVAFLAAMLAKKTIVPLPTFFSNHQLEHIITDAGVDVVLGPAVGRVRSISPDMPTQRISASLADQLPTTDTGQWQLIIYTSGTTGTPKGVRLGTSQVSASVQALASTILPRPDDRYLSILPFSLLLEQVTGILLPIRAGVCSYIASRASTSALSGDIMPFIDVIDVINPSITVLVPTMLDGWVKALTHMKAKAPPPCLRFVAAGGAHVPVDLIGRARKAGIPAFEGYGLSECCSVVAVNAPEADRVGSVGKPLPGVSLSVEQGEIIVTGANVMTGYLGGADVNQRWHTGDIGYIDEDGFLHVQGRADNILVTSLGRNVTPEWIEAMIMSDSRIARCIVFGQGQPALSCIIVPSDTGQQWFGSADMAEISDFIETLCHEAPIYARPNSHVLYEESHLLQYGLIGSGGQINRRAVDAFFCVDDAIRKESR